jgi:hypothetical protein
MPRVGWRTLALSALGFVLVACGRSGDGSGGGLVDRGVCDVLIECAATLAPGVHAEYEAAYGPQGSCWLSGSNAWAGCRDACSLTLDTLNLVGQATGMTCGSCMTDDDCASFGVGAMCSNGVCVGGDPDGNEHADETDGDTNGTSDTNDTSCEHEAPEICLRMVECVGALLPNQRAAAEETYGANGSCWCDTEQTANECSQYCATQVEAALTSYPTEPACQANSCSLAELDPSHPYGPVVNDSCPSWMGIDQRAIHNLFDLPGSVCAPECSGVAQSCPQHPQTAAAGTCYFSLDGVNYCVLRCWVDSTLIGGAQCQCGARCQPHGPVDGEGNQRGVCTFE